MKLQYLEIPIHDDFKNSDFTSLEFTPHMNHPYNSYLIVLGANDGSLTAYDVKKGIYADNGNKKFTLSGEIS